MTQTPRRRMRSATVALGVTALMATGLTGCASEPDYAAVCVDPETEERVDDDQCDDDRDYTGVGAGFFWYYLGASSRVPAIGAPVSGGTFRGAGLNNVQRGGLPAAGAPSVRSSVKSGGFGGSSRGVSS